MQDSGANGRGVREGMNVVYEGESETRGGITEETIREYKLGGEEWKEGHRWSEEQLLSVGLISSRTCAGHKVLAQVVHQHKSSGHICGPGDWQCRHFDRQL